MLPAKNYTRSDDVAQAAHHYFEQDLKILRNILGCARRELAQAGDEHDVKLFCQWPAFREFMLELSYAAERLNKFATIAGHDPLYPVIEAKLDEQDYYLERLSDIGFRQQHQEFIDLAGKAEQALRARWPIAKILSETWLTIGRGFATEFEKLDSALLSVQTHSQAMQVHPEIKQRVFFALSIIAPSSFQQAKNKA